MRRAWRRFWRWLQHGGAASDWERESVAFNREHAARLDDVARIEQQQRQVVQRLRALGLEVEIYQHTENRDEQ